jgi:hypothetical protein
MKAIHNINFHIIHYPVSNGCPQINFKRVHNLVLPSSSVTVQFWNKLIQTATELNNIAVTASQYIILESSGSQICLLCELHNITAVTGCKSISGLTSVTQYKVRIWFRTLALKHYP